MLQMMCCISAIMCMYLPVAFTGFLVYGTSVAGNILQSIPSNGMRVTAEVLITCHVMSAFVIVLNPFSQDMEEVFGVPHSECLFGHEDTHVTRFSGTSRATCRDWNHETSKLPLTIFIKTFPAIPGASDSRGGSRILVGAGEFWPQGGPKPKICLKLPENCPLGPLVDSMFCGHLVSADWEKDDTRLHFVVVISDPRVSGRKSWSCFFSCSEFHWKRCLLRSCIVMVALFIAESVPSFNAILNLLGASTTAFCSFIAPPMLYLRLCTMAGNWPKM